MKPGVVGKNIYPGDLIEFTGKLSLAFFAPGLTYRPGNEYEYKPLVMRFLIEDTSSIRVVDEEIAVIDEQYLTIK